MTKARIEKLYRSSNKIILTKKLVISRQIGWEFPYCCHLVSVGTLPMILRNLLICRLAGDLEQVIRHTAIIKLRSKGIQLNKLYTTHVIHLRPKGNLYS